MDIETFMMHYEAFDKEFCRGATTLDVEFKMIEEMKELGMCLMFPFGSSHDEIISELLDVMNVSLKLLKRYGIHDPLHFGYLKLTQTAEKYRAKEAASVVS